MRPAPHVSSRVDRRNEETTGMEGRRTVHLVRLLTVAREKSFREHVEACNAESL